MFVVSKLFLDLHLPRLTDKKSAGFVGSAEKSGKLPAARQVKNDLSRNDLFLGYYCKKQ